MFNFHMGFGELMLALALVVIVFGSRKLPPLAARSQDTRTRSAHEASRMPDWPFIGTVAVALSFALAVAAVISGHR